jgi:hypothetical protein
MAPVVKVMAPVAKAMAPVAKAMAPVARAMAPAAKAMAPAAKAMADEDTPPQTRGVFSSGVLPDENIGVLAAPKLHLSGVAGQPWLQRHPWRLAPLFWGGSGSPEGWSAGGARRGLAVRGICLEQWPPPS